MIQRLLILFCILIPAGAACAAPELAIGLPPGYSYTVYADNIPAADGLVFDAQGNLYVNSEVGGGAGKITRIAPDGAATVFVSGLNRPDGITYDPATDRLYVSEEVTPGRILQVALDGTVTVLLSGAEVHSPEGIDLDPLTGHLTYAEDRNPGRVRAYDLATGTLTDRASGFQRPEGIDFDPAGRLYIAETVTGRIWRLLPDDTLELFVDAGLMTEPDNVLWDPCRGVLFVTEDANPGRILQVAADGTVTPFATGLVYPQGMVFGPDGALYVSEQGQNRILRITGFSQTCPAVVPGEVFVDPTDQHIGVRWQIQGDDDRDATVTARFRRLGETTWHDALPFFRTHPDLNGEGNGRPDNRFAGSLFWLQPDTTYEIALTLTDPDGGGETRVITTTTRAYGGRLSRPLPTGRALYVVPGNGGGDGSPANPFRGLQAAADAAQPGDLFHVAPGTYAPFTLLASGTPDAPIAFVGPGDPTQNPPADQRAVVDGGGTDRGVVTLGRNDQTIAHVILQGLIIQNGRWGVDAQNARHIVVRRNVIRDVDFGYTNRRQNGLDGDQTLCDNVIEGRTTPWYQPGVIPPEQGIDLQGNSNIVCHNRISRFGDGIAVQPNEPGNQGYAADIFGNEVFDIVDDPIEIDYATANFRVWGNRVTNARMGISLAPIFGGPVYVFRNTFFNTDYATFKMNRQPAGLVVVHNTGVKLGNGTSSDAGWQNTFFRNNVLIGTRYAIEEYGLVSNSLLDDWDYDALGTTDPQRFVKWNDVRYADITDLCAGAGIECHGVELPKADPLAALVHATLPITRSERVEPGGYDLRPAVGWPLIDAGAALPNLNDPFVSDGRPDIGALEAGAPPPHYGPRPPCPLTGDVNADGAVDLDDVLAVAGRWRRPDVWPFDRDADGLVSVLDVMRVAARWRDACGRDLWVWDQAVATDPAARARLFALAADRGVRTVYLESEWLLNHDQPALADFIAAADAQGLAVELLFGDPSWALTPNHGTAVALAQAAVAFAQGASGPQPVGLHFDVEPHALAEWDADPNGMANQYLDLLEALAAVTQGTGLRLTVDIPFWYDDRQVTRDGQTRPLSEWVIDRVDRVVLMDYRDHAAPPDGIVDHAATELTYAATVGKQVVIGVETNCGLSPEKITFCEEGAGAMEAAFNQVRDAYRANPAFAGLAVHDDDGYRVLRP